MKLAVMQPYLFPYIGYYQLAYYSDVYVFYDDVNYIKGGYINRNNILANSVSQRFTWPIEKASSFKKINQLEFSKNSRKILSTIRQSYSKAPYFLDVFPLIERVLQPDNYNVAAVASSSIIEVFNYLGIEKKFIFSSELSYDRELPAQDKLFEICNIIGATDYCNALGGIDLYSKSDFLENNINLYFLKPTSVSYKQQNDEFVPFLSMIDVLMFNSREHVSKMLSEFSFIVD
jgi:hypothetical protein